jgi:hypothetical protein
VADLLVGHGLSLLTIFHWNDAPHFLRDSIIKNKLDLPNFRFCNSWWSFGLCALHFYYVLLLYILGWLAPSFHILS